MGLIEASVSNGVAVNWNGLKNHVDGYHEPAATFIDYTFLRYIPEAETRNGTSEASDEGYSSSKSEKELEWEEMHPGMEAEERTDRVFAPRAISVAEQSAGHVKESRQKAFR